MLDIRVKARKTGIGVMFDAYLVDGWHVATATNLQSLRDAIAYQFDGVAVRLDIEPVGDSVTFDVWKRIIMCQSLP